MALSPGLIALEMHEDSRGQLVSVEGSRDLPFAIERVYYIFSNGGAARGFHAHRSLRQLLVCIKGACRVVLDDGRSRSEHRLDRPDRGLLVDRMIWREMHDFSTNCVLLVLASAHFDESDYIRDYDEFVAQATRETM